MNEIIFVGNFVVTAVLNVWPAFVISILLSVLVRALKLDGAIRRAFQTNVGLAILLATFVGAFSPFCSCTVVPIIAGLLASGVPLAPVMAFWIASPTMDPEIFALSVGILGWPLALVRLAATLVLSLVAGYITLALTSRLSLGNVRDGREKNSPNYSPEPAIEPGIPLQVLSSTVTSAASFMPISATHSQSAIALTPAKAVQSCSSGSCQFSSKNKARSWQFQLTESFRHISWADFGREFLQQSWSLGRWLLLAFFLEALITRYLPQETIASFLGGNNWFAIPLAAIIGILLYLNNLAALPIVSGLLAQGMQSGAAIAFLIAGPVTTIPAMTAVWGVVSRRIFILYLALGLFGAMILGFATNLIGF